MNASLIPKRLKKDLCKWVRFNTNRVMTYEPIVDRNEAGSCEVTVFVNKYVLSTKLVRSRWLDIGQVLFCVFMDRDEVEVLKNAKKKTNKQTKTIKAPMSNS